MHNVPIRDPGLMINFEHYTIKCEYFDKHILELYSNNKYKERQFHYDASALSYAKKKNFYGFFRTEQYFKDIKHILQNELQLADHKKDLLIRVNGNRDYKNIDLDSYVKEVQELVKMKNDRDLSHYRLVVDTLEDLNRIDGIMGRMTKHFTKYN